MAIFPEQMDRLDTADAAGSLRQIEAYIRYTTERMEFSNRNMTREVSEAGVSSVSVYEKLLEVVNAMSVLSSTVNGLSGEVTALSSRVVELQADVTAMQNGISEMQGDISAIQTDISDLTARVAALEGGGTGV